MPDDYRGDWDRSSYDGGDYAVRVKETGNRAEDGGEDVDCGYRGDWDRGGYGSMGDRDRD